MIRIVGSGILICLLDRVDLLILFITIIPVIHTCMTSDTGQF